MTQTGGAPRTAAERGRHVRQRLLRAASELISELGWTAVSTRLVARRAGLAPGLVHYHFASLQALLRQATLAVMRQSFDQVMALLRQADSLDAGLEMLLGALEPYAGSTPTALLFTEGYLASLRDDQLRDELAGLLGQARRSLTQWLAGHGQVAPEATAAVLVAALDGVLLHRALNPDLTPEVVAPVLQRLLIAPRRSVAARRGHSQEVNP